MDPTHDIFVPGPVNFSDDYLTTIFLSVPLDHSCSPRLFLVLSLRASVLASLSHRLFSVFSLAARPIKLCLPGHGGWRVEGCVCVVFVCEMWNVCICEVVLCYVGSVLAAEVWCWPQLPSRDGCAYIYIYIYMYVCMCVCVFWGLGEGVVQYLLGYSRHIADVCVVFHVVQSVRSSWGEEKSHHTED